MFYCIVALIVMPKHNSCKHSPHMVTFSPQLYQDLLHKDGVLVAHMNVEQQV